MSWPGAYDRAAELTYKIGQAAQRRQLQSALRTFAQFASEGIAPTLHTHCNVINAHVVAGDVEGARGAFDAIAAAGFAPNVVAYTTLLKGHCAVGDLVAARALLEEMAGATPPVLPDARTINTFLRGCVRVGDLAAARWAWARLAAWRVVPDPSASTAYVRLLAQGLRLGEVRRAVAARREEAAAARAARGGPPVPPARPQHAQCSYWRAGRCDRGANCRFYHDPSVRQHDDAQKDAERRDHLLAQTVQLAHAAAVLGRRNACRRAAKDARALLDEAAAAAAAGGGAWSGGGDGSGGGGEEEREALGFRREEQRRELGRIDAYVGGGSKAAAPPLDPFFCRAFVFSSRLGAAADADGGGGGGAAVAARLLRALRSTLGLKRAAKLGLASADACGARLARAITKKGRLRWRRVFADGKLPLKLEVAAGTGDWVAAHAAAEAGEANWGALELRHDRVYNIFSRMLLGNHPNLCVMGGDAAAILRNHVKRASVRHIFINFPEPPTGASHAADAAAMAEASDSALHLLTPPFFRAMHAALEPGGRITILSDNEGYCRALAATAAALRDGESRLLVSERIGGAERLAVIDGVHVYKGQPGAAAGHAVEAASYFDRFWEHGSHRARWYLVLRRE